jgi:predicted phosphohydrolase
VRLFAISDLHLSFGVDKPMHVFGEHWEGHADKIRTAWDAMVTADDWVLVGGDTSWGLTLDEAKPDLDWLGERPGRKVLIKGNHCTWWTSRTKVEKVLHPSIKLLQNDAVLLPDDTVVVGTRLWDPPDAPWADEHAAKARGLHARRADDHRLDPLSAEVHRRARDAGGGDAEGGVREGMRVRAPARQVARHGLPGRGRRDPLLPRVGRRHRLQADPDRGGAGTGGAARMIQLLKPW